MQAAGFPPICFLVRNPIAHFSNATSPLLIDRVPVGLIVAAVTYAFAAWRVTAGNYVSIHAVSPFHDAPCTAREPGTASRQVPRPCTSRPPASPLVSSPADRTRGPRKNT